jgi:hypothetical protein
MKVILLEFTVLGFALAMAGCETKSGPDLTPIGNGLGIIGLSLVLAAIIRLLGHRRNKDHEDD